METRRKRKERTGIVVSKKMNKSVVVNVRSKVKHPKYGKFMERSTKFIVHDATEQCKDGDIVRIVETRPLSKLKCWRVVEIIERAK